MLPLLVFAITQNPDWSLHYERSGFMETGSYAEAVDLCNRFAKASPFAKVVTYGRSPEGRAMVALVVSSDKKFAPADMAKSRKPLIFVQNGIHSGEIEGKDASLMLARDMLVTGKEKALREGANWVIVPIFSVDGHERFTPYNRINQNGPRQMGWRGTGQNINLNRDWMKADTPEMQAQVRLVHQYRPDFLFDNHTTDGADYQYVLTLAVPQGPELPPSVAAWQKDMYERVRVACDRDGFLTSPYFGMVDRSDPAKGITVSSFSPRFSHGYWSAMGRPSMLVETHMLKPYKQRVDSTYSVMKRTVEWCISDAVNLKGMVAAVDRDERAGKPHTVLTSRLGPERRPFLFKAWKLESYTGEVSGAVLPRWTRDPVDIPSFIRDNLIPAIRVTPPVAYAIPPAWTDAIDRLSLHGLKFQRLTRPFSGTFSSVGFSGIEFPPAPFEGRFQPQFTEQPIEEARVLPEGTAVVRMDQVGAKLLLHLLEPAAPDSLVRWGLFNNVFERKESFEDYSMEPIAKELLAKDPELRRQFEERLKDPEFAKNSRARLQFVWERSPWFDPRLNKYPVVRLTAGQLAALSLRP